MNDYIIHQGDALDVLRTMRDNSIHCGVTSPPYWGLRDYGIQPTVWPDVSYAPMPGMPEIVIPAMTCCLGLEHTPEAYIGHMVLVFREFHRVLRPEGTCWVNMGDSYAAAPKGSDGDKSTLTKQAKESKRGAVSDHFKHRPRGEGIKLKDLCGIPWRLAFALQADGWWLRSDIIWSKPNPMPESVVDRPTKAHEYIFLLAKSDRYFYDAEAVKEACTQDEYANGFRGGCYVAGATDNQEMGKHQNVGNKKYSFARSVNQPDCRKPQHREGREEVFYQGRRNKRSVWTVATYPFKEAHYATFPPDLIRPCILAGTSARGCCPKCGAPWGRVISKARTLDGIPSDLPAMKNTQKNVVTSAQGISHGRIETQSCTTGWRPTCDCGGWEVVPCTIMDFFSGSGTTGAVSLQEGRIYIGIEASPTNVDMSMRRIEREAAQRPLLVA